MLPKTLLPVLLLVAGCAPATQDRITVTVSVTGAIERRGTYGHAADQAHGCGELRVYGAPGSAGPPHLPTQWDIRLDATARPPAASFQLIYEKDAPSRGPAFLRLTAGGRLWEGGSQVPGYASEIRPGPGHATGSFTARGLRPAEGGEERIAVTGSWTCPTRP